MATDPKHGENGVAMEDVHMDVNENGEAREEENASKKQKTEKGPEHADDAAKHANTTFRKNYKPPPYSAEQVFLNFKLYEDHTRVIARVTYQPKHSQSTTPPLTLNGRSDVKLISVSVNSQPLDSSAYALTPTSLTILQPPEGPLEVESEVEIRPQDNTCLEGLFRSGGNYCTQCEAEGFRGITFFQDRPDVMAKFTTRIEADKKSCPILLSNGNLVEEGELEGDRHFAVWEDPFPKPCYLFALVAGDLKVKEEVFTTMSGRNVRCRIFVSESNLSKVDHALKSLSKAMKWDEEVFGLEYDLEIFNIVAVDDFNMGAMENKSLNIFNSRLVLASPASATDVDYGQIERVVAHEYFHNWTGNRVTCRDWFQLTLKEGLTVFRDQEFSADMNSRPVRRIGTVSQLRASQFAEDAGPMAHPIRPDSYIKMDNFYTRTVYDKGAEVIRLYHTLLGQAGFRKGMDLYFQRHDGQAVTCDDFLAAMADANAEDFHQLGLWYSQAGTPHLHVTFEYDAATQKFTLRTRQWIPETAGQSKAEPMLIPLKIGLLGPDGKDMQLHLEGCDRDLGTETVLMVDEANNEFVFNQVPCKPVPSLLRGFSAPVKMSVDGQSSDDLIFLLAHDSDSFNRWEAGQRLLRELLLHLYEAAKKVGHDCDRAAVEAACAAAGGVPETLVLAFKRLLENDELDGSLKSAALALPASSELMEEIREADPLLLYMVRMFVIKTITQGVRPHLENVLGSYASFVNEPYVFSSESVARRSLMARALGMLSQLHEPAVTQELLSRFRSASNMTDTMAALGALVDVPGPERATALAEFYEKWKHDPLVCLKWIGIQASSNVPNNVEHVKALTEHPAFNITNPNSCYSLFLHFATSPVNFHAADGSGYQFLADSVLKLDQVNHQVAARVVSSFTQWRKFDEKRRNLMRSQLERILATEGLSENVYEIVSKSLA